LKISSPSKPPPSKRGIVGIEAAIVLIAFVIIAAALAYVVVNMGFFSSQKAKDTISRGIAEATSALELEGSVIAKTDDASAVIRYLVIPVKTSVAREGVDISDETMTVSVRISGQSEAFMTDIYEGIAPSYDPTNISETLDTLFSDEENATAYFAVENDDGDEVLDSTEKGILLAYLGTKAGAYSYDMLTVEVKTSVGSSLTVQREIPPGLQPDQFVDLG